MKQAPIIAVLVAIIVSIGGIGYVAKRDSNPANIADSTKTVNQDRVEADGTIVKPDGTMIKLDGTTIQPDGTMIKPDGSIVGADDQKPLENTNSSSTSNVNSSPTNTDSPETSSLPAKYVDYSSASLSAAQKVANGTTVLYFHANWCPTCRLLDPSITKNLNSLPSGLTILKVDYDQETALKKKYGVTYQHTFVQVDALGNKLKLWSGTTDATDITKQII